jgi:hypothetical protein
MRATGSGALALLLLAGCAPARPALRADAPAPDRARAAACHTRAVAAAAQAVPYIDTSTPTPRPKKWTWWEIALAPLLVAGAIVQAAEGGAVLIATSPVWVPWWLTKVHRARRESYQRNYRDCMTEAPGDEPAGRPPSVPPVDDD